MPTRIPAQKFELAIPGVTINDFQDPKHAANASVNIIHAWATADFEAFSYNPLIGWDFGQDRFTWNDSTSSVRIFARPGYHSDNNAILDEKPIKLHDALAYAVAGACKSQSKALRAYLIEEGPVFDIPFFTPLEWEGKKLIVPVEFIEISEIWYRSRNNEEWVEANIQVGHYMSFFGVVLHTSVRDFQDSRLKDPLLKDIIARAIAQNHSLNNQITNAFVKKNGWRDYDNKFLLAPNNFNPNGIIPPIRFE